MIFTDDRDGKIYPTVDINGTIWLAANLQFETDLSDPPSNEQMANAPDLVGRYYHLEDLDCACPTGWALPDTEDWLNYFEHLSELSKEDVTIRFSADITHFAIDGYDKKIDIFAKGNPLGLAPTARVEGDQFFLPSNYADFWVLDPLTYSTTGKAHEGADHIHLMPKVIDGKTHIHIRQKGWSNIHSHEHHLNPKKLKKLRKFMIRCVKVI